VEDATDIREVFAMLLHTEGAEVVATDSAIEAVTLIRQESFDVVLTDLGLPDLPGEAVVRTAATARPRPWIVVVTGYGEPLTSRAREAGADAVLIKPVAWASLVTRLTPRQAPDPLPSTPRALAA
jgi:CheY-like chemotaxis protein